ncbi:MAG: hypothetical protein ACLPPV_06960 [Candidatus Korobacteraceae bacterium]
MINLHRGLRSLCISSSCSVGMTPTWVVFDPWKTKLLWSSTIVVRGGTVSEPETWIS